MAGLLKTGYRKTAVAKIILKAGSGKIIINGKDYKKYFPSFYHNYKIIEPLRSVGKEDQFDLRVNVKGGGISSQAEAIRQGIAQALTESLPNVKHILKENNLLTRDIRIKERKKYGLKKARKARQYRKR
jgi:small subunit ribosomal protein S9